MPGIEDKPLACVASGPLRKKACYGQGCKPIKLLTLLKYGALALVAPQADRDRAAYLCLCSRAKTDAKIMLLAGYDGDGTSDMGAVSLAELAKTTILYHH